MSELRKREEQARKDAEASFREKEVQLQVGKCYNLRLHRGSSVFMYFVSFIENARA